ncbi:MAG: anthranilate synthase component I, partial [Planctomycetaceae bacterium]
MTPTPDFATVRQLAASARLVPIYRQILSDTLTPVSAFHKLGDDEHAFLFESVVGGERIGRYSFLGSGPFLQLEAYGHDVAVTADGQTSRQRVADPLRELQTV